MQKYPKLKETFEPVILIFIVLALMFVYSEFRK